MFKLSLIEGIKNIDKNKFLTYLTVFLFALVFLLQGYTMSYFSTNKIFESYINNDSIQKYHLYGLGFNGVSPRQLYKLYPENLELETAEYFEDIDSAEHITYVGVDSGAISISDFKGDIRVFAEEVIENDIYVYCLNVTPNFFEVENYRVIEGRDFTVEDMPYVEGKPRAVLLGYKYRNVYNVGDILTVNGERSKSVSQIEVIGFLAEDTTIMECAGNAIYDLDNYIVYPEYIIPIEEWEDYEKNVLSFSINRNYNYAWGALKIMFAEESESDGLVEWQTAINNYGNLGKYLKILDSEYVLEKSQSRFESLTEFFAEITAVMIFFSTITILISIRNRVANNVKDYAIHIVVGATRGSTIGFIIAEMSIILTCSVILGIIATKWLMYYINMPFYFWQFLGVYVLTSVIILALSAIVARLAIRKYDICTLIK